MGESTYSYIPSGSKIGDGEQLNSGAKMSQCTKVLQPEVNGWNFWSQEWLPAEPQKAR